MRNHFTMAVMAMAVGLVLGLAAPAQATLLACTPSGFSPTTGTPECEGAFAGNHSASVLNGLEAFGQDDWSLFQKFNTDTGNEVLGVPQLAIGTPNLTSGTWSIQIPNIEDLIVDYIFAAAIKAADQFVLYQVDMDAACGSFGTCGGSWSTASILNNGGQQPALSNFALYMATSGGSIPTPVPAPPALALLSIGLVGLVMARRRRAG